MIEVLKQMYQLLLTEPHAPTVCNQLEVILRQAIAELESQEPVDWVDSVMEQAQVFASAWSIVGSRFAGSKGLENAEQAKAELRAMLTHPPQRTKRKPIAMLFGSLPVYDTPSQRTWVGLDWLPEHKCGLHLSHNEHRDVYETIENFYDPGDFVSEEEWLKAVAGDSVWVLHWYPNTPVGFNRIAASTLEAIEAKLKEKNNA